MFYVFWGDTPKFGKSAERKTLPPDANCFGKKQQKIGAYPLFS
jgi:hypothetical protein